MLLPSALPLCVVIGGVVIAVAVVVAVVVRCFGVLAVGLLQLRLFMFWN